MNFLLKKLLKNLGRVDGILRSGQPGWFRLRILYWLFSFKSVINLAHSPATDKEDLKEIKFCNKRGIEVHTYGFGAGGPRPFEEEADKIIDIIDVLPKPVWIHCEGGKDRTGGIVMRWMIKKGYSLESVFGQAYTHKVPAEGWLKWALYSTI